MVHSFTKERGLPHENKKYYASIKFNAGIVIDDEICPPIAPHFGAQGAILVQFLLFMRAPASNRRVDRRGGRLFTVSALRDFPPTAFPLIFC